MKITRNALFISVISLTLISCNSSSTKVELGKSATQDLIQAQGEPISIVSLESSDSDAKLYYYKNEVSYQVNGSIVRGHYRNPKGDEVKLSYWRNKWAGFNKIYQVLGEGEDKELAIREPISGTSIIYNQMTSKVVRVMEFKGE